MNAPVSPVEPKAEYAQYAWLSLVALFGSIARAARWMDAAGKLSPQKLITEVATAVVLGAIAAGFGAYMNWKPEIVGGIAGCMGLIGPAGVTSVIQNIISTRFGGKDDAGDPKPS